MSDELLARESQVLELAARGLSNAAIADRLNMSEKSVDKHMGHIYATLNIEGPPEYNARVVAVRWWLDYSKQR